jgi:miniconductance mechanosensitive channel
MKKALTDWIISNGMSEEIAAYGLNAALVLAIIALSILSEIIAKRVVLSGLSMAIKKSRASWDDALMDKKVLSRLAHLAPALVIYILGPLAFPEVPTVVYFLKSTAVIYMVIVTVLAAVSFLDAATEIYQKSETAKQFHIKGFVQAAKIVLIFIGIILVLSGITGKTPLFFLSGLGALTAVLILVFKDAILGLVAGVQLSTNNMVRKGDWIEMPQFGADGDVLDVSLTTVKVQNWDKTIATIPTYALISQSFKNWRGMQESGGRRIKRALYMDMNSIKFLSGEMIEKLSRVQHIREYLDRKTKEIEDFNRERNVDESSLINGRRLTNIGTFRAYVEAYLKNHPNINNDMTFLVRQLQPTENGLPLEIYVFSSDQVWANYEAIQSDIFDHLLAAMPEFDLRVFQQPAGADFQRLAK